MFLGFSEIKYEKGRFILIISIVALISYLTYFLTALAYGLATSYTQGIDKWDATGIVMQTDANSNVARSIMTESDYQNISLQDGGQKARLGVSSGTVQNGQKEDVSLFGIDLGSFLVPSITDGSYVSNDGEVVVSDELKSLGIDIGENLSLSGSSKTFRVVGFTNNATFQTAPIIYLGLEDWRSLTADLSGMTSMKDSQSLSAAVIKDSHVSGLPESLSFQTINDYIFTLPGYGAQVATFGTMIGFLIFTSSFILAIFIYILTTQKKNIFGILKAEGIPNRYISRSVQSQVILLATTGMLIGLGLTVLSGLGFGDKLPFMIQPVFFLIISSLFLICAAIGGIASVRVVTKIDPVEAIG